MLETHENLLSHFCTYNSRRVENEASLKERERKREPEREKEKVNLAFHVSL